MTPVHMKVDPTDIDGVPPLQIMMTIHVGVFAQIEVIYPCCGRKTKCMRQNKKIEVFVVA